MIRGTRMRFGIALVVALATAGIAAGCGDDNGGGDLGLIKDGQLLAGIDTPFPPFEKAHPPNVTGYDIDVINAIADEMGLEVVQ
jgi:ABC-type amino acid transport substrate-binding protein